jgi:Transposase, Mutator family
VTRKQDSAKGKITAEDLKRLLAEDRDLLKTIIEETLQQVLEAEMDEALQASKGERTAGRLGYRAGYYNRMLVTRIGHIELRVPQDRQGRFRTEVFERYQRSEKALVAAMLEMYVQGVSTRKVKTITEELCGHEFSSATISRIVQKLDEELERFARRRLEEPYPYLILDARYEKVREDGAVRSQAVLIAIGRRLNSPAAKVCRAGRNCWPVCGSVRCTESSSWSAMIMPASAARFRKCCPKRCGNAATCTFCAMHSTICRARPTMIVCRSCVGSTIVATHKKRDRTFRPGC